MNVMTMLVATIDSLFVLIYYSVGGLVTWYILM
jgi:hypothetical protein